MVKYLTSTKDKTNIFYKVNAKKLNLINWFYEIELDLINLFYKNELDLKLFFNMVFESFKTYYYNCAHSYKLFFFFTQFWISFTISKLKICAIELLNLLDMIEDVFLMMTTIN